jgi:hypothetical protein
MARRDAGGIAGLEDVRERLESWRRTRTTRGIPEVLWRSAVRLARRAGVYAVARGLGLNYDSLKQRVDAAAGSGDGSGRPPAFIEIDTGGGGFAGGGLTVELSDPSGRRLTIRAQERGSVDLAALLEAFWSRGA